MNKLEAVLHYGITRREPPTASELRSLFFATVLAMEDGEQDFGPLACRLARAYCAAKEVEDLEVELGLLSVRGAEKLYQETYLRVLTEETGLTELPDGLGWWELPSDEGCLWPQELVRDLAALMCFHELNTQRAVAEYFQSEEGQARLARIEAECKECQ
jgi:hypothetical protein